jgi:hypothetical protein
MSRADLRSAQTLPVAGVGGLLAMPPLGVKPGTRDLSRVSPCAALRSATRSGELQTAKFASGGTACSGLDTEPPAARRGAGAGRQGLPQQTATRRRYVMAIRPDRASAAEHETAGDVDRPRAGANQTGAGSPTTTQQAVQEATSMTDTVQAEGDRGRADAARSALVAHDALRRSEEKGDGFEIGYDDLPVDATGWLEWHTHEYLPAFRTWSAAMYRLADVLGAEFPGRHPLRFRPVCQRIVAAANGTLPGECDDKAPGGGAR